MIAPRETSNGLGSERSPRILLFAPASGTAPDHWRGPLERAGFQVEEVSDRGALASACAHRRAELVIFDVDGSPDRFEACRAVVASVSVPVVVLGDESDLEPAERAGATDCLVRPSSTEIVQRVRRALEHVQLARERERALRDLATSRAFGGIGSWTLDGQSGAFECSPEAGLLLGLETLDGPSTKAELVAVVDPADRARFEDWLERAISGEGVAPIEHMIASPIGTARRVRQYAGQTSAASGAGVHLTGLVRALEAAAAPNAGGRQTALAEALTGIADRSEFIEKLASAIAAAQRPYDQIAVFLVHLDFDGLPERFAAREQRELVLGALVQRMKESIRDRDLLGHLGSSMRDVSIARIGAQRFTILLPGLARAHDAYKVARRIHDSLAEPLSIEGDVCRVQPSFGIAMSPSDGATPGALLEAADSAAHGACQTGHSAIRFFTPAMNASAFERLTLEASLRRALEREELLVHYQPKIEIATGRIVGFEALVRWKHPDLGMVSPAQFIPIAEETGLIIPIGEYVLATACAQNKTWQDEGLPSVRMAVNLSSVQFRSSDLAATVQRILSRANLAPEWLELELTESILLQRAEATIATLHSLKKTGIRLAIDDFGTGYSSLSYLKRFPIDTLKIDQSFIREVTTNPEDAAITTSIILMGKSLNLHVVAEGVETQSQLAFLKVLDCDEAQGFLFSRPVPAEQAGQLLATAVANYR